MQCRRGWAPDGRRGRYAILPTIIDTPANRRDMPEADRSTWISPDAIAAVVAFPLSDDAASISGAAIPVG